MKPEVVTDRADFRSLAADCEPGTRLPAERPHVGVQFHPESILTDGGMALVENSPAMATGGES